MGHDILTPGGYRALTAHMAGVLQQATASLQSGKSENPSACSRIFQCIEATYPTRPPSRDKKREMASSPSLQTRIPVYMAFWGNYLSNLQLRDWGTTRHGCEDMRVSGLRCGQCPGRTSHSACRLQAGLIWSKQFSTPPRNPVLPSSPFIRAVWKAGLDPAATDSTQSLPPPNKKGETVCLIGAEQSSNLTTEGITAPCLQGPSVAGRGQPTLATHASTRAASGCHDSSEMPARTAATEPGNRTASAPHIQWRERDALLLPHGLDGKRNTGVLPVEPPWLSRRQEGVDGQQGQSQQSPGQTAPLCPVPRAPCSGGGETQERPPRQAAVNRNPGARSPASTCRAAPRQARRGSTSSAPRARRCRRRPETDAICTQRQRLPTGPASPS